MKIIIDVLGGDNAPAATVDGALLALKEINDLELVLVGDKAYIEPRIKGFGERVEIIHSTENISFNDVPTAAIKQKTSSSLVLGLEALKNREDCHAIVSAGSTGAILTGAFMKIGRIEGVSRPALCPLLPTKMPNVKTMLIDCGANMDCKPQHLVHFALMANVYLKATGTPNPRIALVSVGTEEHKGNELTHQTFGILKKLPINFVGNMEARDAFSGEYDVIVCDGFVGNVLLKTAEGTMSFMGSLIKKACKSGPFAMFGALFLKRNLNKMKKIASAESTGGTMFLGIKKPVIKAHGNSTSVAFKNAIVQAIAASKTDLRAGITKAIADNSEIINAID